MTSTLMTSAMVSIAREAYEVGTDVRKAMRSSAKLVADLQKQWEAAPDVKTKAEIEEALMIGLIAEQMAKHAHDEGELIKRKVSDGALDEAALVFFSEGAKAQPKDGIRQRSEDEERYCTNARSAKKIIMRLAGLGTVSKKGGDRQKTVTVDENGPTEDKGPTKQQAPAVVDKAAAYKWLAEYTAIGQAFVLRNKPHLNERCIALTDQYRRDMIAAMKD